MRKVLVAGNSSLYALMLCCVIVSLVDAHDPGKFGYTGALGPKNWGNLESDFALCSKGKQQSPINIQKDDVVLSTEYEPLLCHYKEKNATLVDNIFNVALNCDKAAGSFTVKGLRYRLKQMHWHSPSEHTIDGRRFAMEQHLVHVTEEGNLSVVAILYKYGRADPFLSQIKHHLEELAMDVKNGDEDVHIPVEKLNMKMLERSATRYFRYIGSSSTPPCTENIVWNVIGKAREMSKEQAAALRAPLGIQFRHNARPTQPLNGRIVSFHDEHRSAHRA